MTPPPIDDTGPPDPWSHHSAPDAREKRSALLSQLDLDQPLADLALLTHRTIPGSDGVGVTLLEDGVPLYRSSNVFSKAADDMQYGIGEGPCIEAVARAQTIVTGSVGSGEQRWPRFVEEALTLQVASVLSLPLTVADQVIGSINVYARAGDAFAPGAVTIGEQFAGPAASALSTARLLVETLDTCDFAGYDLADRAVMETAVGVLMGTHALSAADARRRLQIRAAASGTSLKAASAQVIADVRGRSAER